MKRINNPILFYNSSRDDEEAIQEILEAKINCDLFGPISEENTPLLICNSIRYFGLEGVREFLKKEDKSK